MFCVLAIIIAEHMKMYKAMAENKNRKNMVRLPITKGMARLNLTSGMELSAWFLVQNVLLIKTIK